MDLITENIPYENEKIDLIITPSLLKNPNDIIYNKNYPNIILINNYYLEFTSIKISSEKNDDKSSLSIITNNLSKQNDLTLMILTDCFEDSSRYLEKVKSIFDKDNYREYNIKNISYKFYDFNKDKKYKGDDISDISIEKNQNILIKMKIIYNDEEINSSLKIFIINNSYENICPFLCLNHKDYDIVFLKAKMNYFLNMEKKIQKLISNTTVLNADFIENINAFKNETFDYFTKFINNIEKTYNQFHTTKLLTKNDFANVTKELKSLLDKINKDNYKFKQSSIYQEYIRIYNNNDNNGLSEKNEEKLKSLFIQFNNLNEEMANLLEKKDIDKKEISNLKSLIKFLQSQIKQEKQKKRASANEINNLFVRSGYKNSDINTIESNNMRLTSNNYFKKNEIPKNKHSIFNSLKLNNNLSAKKPIKNPKRNCSMDAMTINSNYNRYIRKSDNKYNDSIYLKNKISQLYEIITNLKSNNEILKKSNQKMKKDIRNLNNIIAKLQRNNEEKEDYEYFPKSGSIKALRIKPKIFDIKRLQYSGQKRHKKNQKISNLYINNNNTINNDIIIYENKNMSRNNNNYNDDNNYFDNNNNLNNRFSNSTYNITSNNNEDKHLALLNKIHDENKNMGKTINDYYYREYHSIEKDRERNKSTNDYNDYNNNNDDDYNKDYNDNDNDYNNNDYNDDNNNDNDYNNNDDNNNDNNYNNNDNNEEYNEDYNNNDYNNDKNTKDYNNYNDFSNDNEDEEKYKVINYTSKKPKKTKKVYNNNIKLYTDVKKNKRSSAPKIKVLRPIYNK